MFTSLRVGTGLRDKQDWTDDTMIPNRKCGERRWDLYEHEQEGTGKGKDAGPRLWEHWSEDRVACDSGLRRREGSRTKKAHGGISLGRPLLTLILALCIRSD